MAFYEKFPYTNFQELNLDWLTQEVSKVRDNRDASDASAAAALASEQAAKASETAAAASQQAAANSETAAAGSEAASADYLAQIGTHTAGAVADWLKENLTTTTPPIDATLTVSGAAADAKKTGDAIRTNINTLTAKSMTFNGNVAVNTDLNDYQSVGYYTLNMTKSDYLTLKNAPDLSLVNDKPSGMFMEVISTTPDVENSGFKLQRIRCNAVDNNIKNSYVYRYGNESNGTFKWHDWNVDLASAHSLYKLSNDLHKLSNDCGAFGKQIKFTLPPNENATSIAMDYHAKAGDKLYFVITDSKYNYTGDANIFFTASKDGHDVGIIKVIANPDASNNDVIYSTTLKNDIDTLYLKTNKKADTTITTFEGYIEILQSVLTDKITTLENEISKVIHVGKDKEYTSILPALIDAEKFNGSTVYVDSGTYDVIDEFKKYYGNDYFKSTNYTSQENYRGLPLTNNVHVIFASGASVTGSLDGENASDAAKRWFSIWNCGDDLDNIITKNHPNTTLNTGFILENVTTIGTTNLRYLVHDEHGACKDSYTNKYINCKWVLKASTDIPSRAINIIGGGLGNHAYIVITNNYFECPDIYGLSHRCVSYHNMGTDKAYVDSESEIHISDCYVSKGTFVMSSHGPTPETIKSTMYVNNCRTTHEPVSELEIKDPSDSNYFGITNTQIKAWNNVIENN